MSFGDNTQLNGMKKTDIVSKNDLQLKHKEVTLKTDRRKDQKDKKIIIHVDGATNLKAPLPVPY